MTCSYNNIKYDYLYSTRCLNESATPLSGLYVWQFVDEGFGGCAATGHAHGPVVGFVDDFLYLARHVHPDRAAFGQVAADHAVAVLVARPLPAGVWVGEVRGHAQFVTQPRVVCELGAVVVRDTGPGAGGGALVRDDARHEEPGPPFDPGVQVGRRPR